MHIEQLLEPDQLLRQGSGQNKTIYILYVSLRGRYKARGQYGVSGSYMDSVFEPRAHKASENWASLPHIGLLQLRG